MAATGFRFSHTLGGQRDLLGPERELAPSIIVAPGDLLVWDTALGKLVLMTSNTGTPDYVADVDKTSTATGAETAQVVPALQNYGVWKIKFTPLHDGLVASSGSTTTAVIAAGSGISADVYNGGLVYCVELNETRIILDSSGSSGSNVTLTVLTPFSATLSGKTLRVVRWGFASAAVKLKTASVHNAIGTDAGDDTGGKVAIYDVDMQKKIALVIFKP